MPDRHEIARGRQAQAEMDLTSAVDAFRDSVDRLESAVARHQSFQDDGFVSVQVKILTQVRDRLAGRLEGR